jgi:hypothetical protein
LLENLAYREGVAWQNVGYNQPANLSYLLSEGLVTAQLSEGEVTQNSIDVNFTEANDGDRYGHEITGYEIYRADGENGEYEKIDTVDVADLKTASASSSGSDKDSSSEPVDLKFDFGAGRVKDGWTQVLADTTYSEDLGYGFTDSISKSNKYYKELETTDYAEYAELYEDCVLGWDTSNGSCEFVADVPNGTYEVTLYLYNGSGSVYNQVSAEGTNFTDIRRGKSAIEGTIETITVEVTDGQLNLTNTISKSGNPGIYFTALEIKSTDYDEWLENKNNSSNENSNENSKESKTYVYTDKSVKAGSSYSYKIAAVVDGKTSYMSRPITIETAVAIDSIAKLDDIEIVAGTPIEEGKEIDSLLPQTVEVTTESGEVIDSQITWDVSDFSIDEVGEYTLYGTIKGYSKKISIKVKVVANEVVGYEDFDDITSIVGVELTLPSTVNVTYTNTTKEAKKVTWDESGLDITKVGDYTLKGSVEGTDDTVTIVIHIKDTYITSVATAYAEVDYQSEDVEAQLPVTVVATYADEKTGNSVVTWNSEDVAKIDTNTIGTYEITGAIDGFDTPVKAKIKVNYAITAAFDFGIKTASEQDGWTGITVNAKGGTKTVADLGIGYTEEKGYGFTDETASIQGREEDYTVEGYVPQAVYTDFAIPDGQTFVVDVPNGEYKVDVIGGSIYKSTVKGSVEDVAISVGNSAGTYTQTTYDVTVEDGQMTFNFTASATSRLDGIIIRLVKAADSTDNSGATDNSGDADNSGNTDNSGDADNSGNTDNSGDADNSGNSGSLGDSSNDDKIDNGGSEESGSSSSTGSSNDSNSSDSSSSDSDSSDDSGSSSSNGNVTITDPDTPLASAPALGNGVLNVKLEGKYGKFKPQAMQKYYGQYNYISTNLGNGVGITIDGSQFKGNESDVNLGFTMVKMPGFAEGFEAYRVTPYESSKLSYAIDVHMNFGKKFEGKTAYVFELDNAAKTYDRKEIVAVNEIGNVALHTNEVSDIIVLIAD